MKLCSAISNATSYRPEHRCEIFRGVVMHAGLRAPLCSRHMRMAKDGCGIKIWKYRKWMP